MILILQYHRGIVKKYSTLSKKKSKVYCYPSSHNHGSVEKGCISNISFLSFRVIFHFHDYGRKVRYMGVSKNSGTPKWMVKIMENPMNKWMIWGYPYSCKHPYCPSGML